MPTPSERDHCALSMYIDKGDDEGIYTTSVTMMNQLITFYINDPTDRKMKDVRAVLTAVAPIRPLDVNPDHIAVQNGVWDYKEKKLLPFSPDMVFLSKAPVPYNEHASNPVIHDHDEVWDFDSWLADLHDDEDITHLIWQMLGASVRPNVQWDKAIFLYGEQGANGKGTLCSLMETFAGMNNIASLNLKDLSGAGSDSKKLEQIIGCSLIIGHENVVGAYLDDSATLKSLVTGDRVSVNRLYQQSVSLTFHGLVVQCLNDIPKIRDRTDSFTRRCIFIPFPKTFAGNDKRYIKHDYLKRPETLQYVLKRILESDYYQFDVPPACDSILDEFRTENSSARRFLQAFMSGNPSWAMYPLDFLFEAYCNFCKEESGASREKGLGRNRFAGELKSILRDDAIWAWFDMSTHDTIRSKGRMDLPEPLIAEFNVTKYMSSVSAGNGPYNGKDGNRICSPIIKDKYASGIILRSAMPDTANA